MNQLAVHDPTPIFVRAIAHGVRNNILTPERLEELRREGPGIIATIAKKYGSPIQVASLRENMGRLVQCVSLYLYKETEGLTEAAKHIQSHTLELLFRKGFTLIAGLDKLPSRNIYIQRGGNLVHEGEETPDNVFRKITAPEASAWVVYEEIRSKRLENSNKSDFIYWLIRESEGGNVDKKAKELDKLLFHPWMVIDTVLFWKIIHPEAIRVHLSEREVWTVVESLQRDGLLLEKAQDIWKQFASGLRREWQDVLYKDNIGRLSSAGILRDIASGKTKSIVAIYSELSSLLSMSITDEEIRRGIELIRIKTK